MAKTLHNQVVIVTGASSGIGRATACELARRGAQVVLAAPSACADDLSAVHREIEMEQGVAIAVPTDITDAKQILNLERTAIATYGRVDVLVNNAGVAYRGYLAEMPLEDITEMVQVNLLGAMLATRAVLPGMLERRQGVIISVASVAGLIASEPLYSGTKFGLRGFSLALRRQLRGTGVTTSVISPGYIQTPMTAYRKRNMPGPELIARAIAKLATSPVRELIIPRRYHIPIWLEQTMPWVIDRFTDGL